MANTIRQAAEELDTLLRPYDWFQTVGMAEDALHIYLNKRTNDKILRDIKKAGWQGFNIVVSVVGKIRPAS